jgi:hypothetical protein
MIDCMASCFTKTLSVVSELMKEIGISSNKSITKMITGFVQKAFRGFDRMKFPLIDCKFFNFDFEIVKPNLPLF